jgi:hypothetical protein
MAIYQITCVIKCNQAGSSAPNLRCDHITDVGFGDGERGSVPSIYRFIRENNTFYTVSPSSGTRAYVKEDTCARCHVDTLRSIADEFADNNLDNLPTCR